MSKSENAADNLTGVWNGMFRQVLVGSVAFTATLIESGQHITGSTHEECVSLTCPRKTHLATLSGYRNGRAVSFLKSYDPPGFGYNTVRYSGQLNGDATEIAGTWTIDRHVLGTFVMTRAGRRAEADVREKVIAVE